MFDLLDTDPEGPTRVLHVEDDASFAALTAEFLERDDRVVETAPDAETGLERLRSGEYDCVVSDYDMPGRNGLEFLERVRVEFPELPFVLFTGKGSETVASEAISVGVSEYLQKGSHPEQFRVLGNRIDNLVDRFRTERALEETRERLSLFVEQSALGIIQWGLDGTFQGCNPAAEEILGYDEAELAGESYEVIVAEESRTDVEAVSEELATGSGGFHSVDRNRRADGTVITCEWHNRVLTDENGEVVAVFALFQDVTDQYERERELETARARYRSLVENFPDGGVFLFDSDLQYTLAAGQGLAAVGLSSADFEGATPDDLFPEAIAEETAEHYRRALAGERTTFGQSYQGGHYRIVTLPVRGDDGEVIAGMAVSQDVTDRTEQEASLERQIARLEEFAAVVSHDLRNPLGVARGRLDLARDECDSDHLEVVERAQDRMATLIEDLLTLARTGGPIEGRDPVDLNRVATESWATVPTADAEVSVPATGTVRADEHRLRQLLENLFRNCIEHGSAEGDTPPDDVSVTVGDTDEGFFITDDGPGIPEDERESVFDSAYTTSEDGTGLGLPIVQRIAEAHGWTVRVGESESGGARFEVTGVEFVD